MSTAVTMELKMTIKNEDQYVLCKVCNKEFSCGKAVGGHMRVHKEMHGRKLELARPRLKSSNGGFHADDVTTCKLCGKVFPSMKSLFGHMRCHPERDWRGMKPPSAVMLPPSKKNVSWADIKKWPVTAPRGRHVCGGQIKVEEADDDLFSAAVEGLIMLARGGVDDNEEDKYSAGHELSDMSQSKDESEKKMISCSSKKKAVTKKRKLKTLEAVTGSKSYGCSTCNRGFPTSQALGGHRARHKKSKSYRGDEEEEGDEEDGGEEAATGRRVLNFDLNELPQVEDGGAVDIIALHDD